MTPLTDVSSAYGAPMGRGNTVESPELPQTFEIERLIWVDGCYDQGGAYWGRTGREDYIFRACSDEGSEMFVRAKSFPDATAQILETFPHANFADSRADELLAGMVECMLWAERDVDSDSDEPLDLNYSADDIAPEFMNALRADCIAFLAENTADLESYVSIRGKGLEYAGHDLWLDRSESGCGFRDRGDDPVFERLSAAAHEFPAISPYVGDDGKIYGM